MKLTIYIHGRHRTQMFGVPIRETLNAQLSTYVLTEETTHDYGTVSATRMTYYGVGNSVKQDSDFTDPENAPVILDEWLRIYYHL